MLDMVATGIVYGTISGITLPSGPYIMYLKPPAPSMHAPSGTWVNHRVVMDTHSSRRRQGPDGVQEESGLSDHSPATGALSAYRQASHRTTLPLTVPHYLTLPGA